jgi:hypothetical protein
VEVLELLSPPFLLRDSTMASSSAWWVGATKAECRAFAKHQNFIQHRNRNRNRGRQDFSLAVGALATTPLHPSCRHPPSFSILQQQHRSENIDSRELLLSIKPIHNGFSRGSPSLPPPHRRPLLLRRQTDLSRSTRHQR